MIPKIIHYCWFGGNPLPNEYKKYIDSWKKFCPDYEIKEWNESNYDVSKNKYMYDAYKEKKWGFVPDYARFDIIYEHGGFYLDTDVELVKSLDELIELKGYLGFETAEYVNGGLGFGAEKENSLIKKLRDMYDDISFYNEDSTLNLLPSPHYITECLKKCGLLQNNIMQIIEDVTIFPSDYFAAKDYFTGEITLTPNTISIHQFSASWQSVWERTALKIDRCKNRNGLEYKIRRMISFPFRVISKIDKMGWKKTVEFAVGKVKKELDRGDFLFMNVDEITEKLNMYDELPYHCVFFNGVWGIGKSYAVDHVENTGRIVRVSLSGVKNSEEIYTAVLDAFVSKAGFTNVITKVAKTAVGIASNFESTKVAGNVISDVTDSFLSAKNKLSIYFRGQRKLRVVVLDDFERVWDGIDITEVFRTIDFFTSIKNVKVAIVGDLTKLPEEIKSKFDRYSERYIEKIYSVTDISKKIDWDAEPLGIDSDFILQFRTLHPFHNLRSAIKANNFYKDIRTLIIKRSTIVKPDSKRFWEDLRLTAFALVIESIDKIKLDEVYKRYSHDNLQNEFVSGMVKTLENRVSMYLNESKFGPALLMPLAKYYESDDLNISEFENIYRQSLENDTPAYFYSDSETIKRDLPAVKNTITQEEDPYKLLGTIRDYVKLCRLSGENDQDGVADFKKQLHKIVMNLIEQNSLEAIDTSHFPFVLENAELLKAANYEFTEGRKLMIQRWIDRMIKGDYTKSELEIADKLSLYGRMDIEYKKQIKARYPELLCENIFPINARNDIQYRTCVIMLKLLHGLDSEKLASYYQKLMKSDLDSAAKNRCERAMERLDG